MAKTKTTSTQHPKSKTSIFLCCFGSHMPKKEKEADYHVRKQKRSRWFSWLRIGMNRKSTSKTVPLEASFSNNVNKAYSKSSRSKSSSTLHKSKTQLINSPPPTQPPLVLPGTPYYTPSQTRHGPNNNNAEDTLEQVRTTIPTRTKRQDRRLSSSTMQKQTTSKPINARGGGSYDAIVGISVLLVTLIIIIFWGRLCAILCTSSWLYFIPRFRKITTVNDDDDDLKLKLNDVDLDSEKYKKKVIMEGLLGRNHRG